MGRNHKKKGRRKREKDKEKDEIQDPQKLTKQPLMKKLRKLIDKRVIISGVVTALLTTLMLSAVNYIASVVVDYQERKELRTRISEETQYRIQVARPDVANDANLAIKHLNGISPNNCLHADFIQVSMFMLLKNWESAGGAKLDPELLPLASKPSPTTDELQRLIELLDDLFPGPDAGPRLLNSGENEPNSDAGPSKAGQQDEAESANGDANEPQESPAGPASSQPAAA